MVAGPDREEPEAVRLEPPKPPAWDPAVSVILPDGTALDRPKAACPCGCVVWWHMPHRGLLCGRCHPPAKGVAFPGLVDIRPYLAGTTPRLDKLTYDQELPLPEPGKNARRVYPFTIEQETIEYEEKTFTAANGVVWKYREKKEKPKPKKRPS